MKRFKALRTYLLLFLILSVFSLTGCGTWFPTSKPTVTLTNPANGATGVYINTKISATFSQEMDSSTINTSTFVVGHNGTAVPGTVAYIGVNAVFIPSTYLIANTEYTAMITAEATNREGNAMTKNYSWTFTTGATADLVPPTVTFTVPADTAVGVATNMKVAATFSEAMDPLSITASTFTLKQGTTPVLGTVAYAGVTAVFKPSSNLEPGTLYTATITTAASDLTGNALAATYVWSFTTGAGPDTTPPTITLVNPADTEIDVPLNSSINATFSEPMDVLTITNLNFLVAVAGGGASVQGIVNYDPITNIATFIPDNPLAASTKYTATIGTEVMDLAGNAMVHTYVWSFTTGTSLVPDAIPLGLIAPYGTFGGTSEMKNTGNLSVINGDIATTATGTSNVTGWHDEPVATYTYGVTAGSPHNNYDVYTETAMPLGNQGQVNGMIYTCTNSTTGPTTTASVPNCQIATNARLAAIDVYDTLALMPADGPLAGNLAGTTIYPGVYTNASSVMIQGGDLTLDGLGDINAVFVFQIGSTLLVGGPGVAAPQTVHLTNGAKAKNVFWNVGTSATINAAGGGTMEGNIFAQTAITISTVAMATPVILNGRAISLTAGVNMNNTIVNLPTP